MNRICEKIKPLLSEHVDGDPDNRRDAVIDDHLANCSGCAKLLESLRAGKSLLGALPLRQTSAGFDEALSRRIAALSRPSAKRSWFEWPGRNLWRPALATLAVAGVAFGWIVTISTQIVKVPAPVPIDNALIAQCVEQHRSYVDGQPLTDWSAQTLARQLDSASASDPQTTD